jgi:hypothetical protein
MLSYSTDAAESNIYKSAMGADYYYQPAASATMFQFTTAI